MRLPNLTQLLLVLPAILIAITIHEFSHAASAYALGDRTAARQGRLSLNPLVHLDPIGTLMIVFTAIAGFGIGWGRPVPVNPYQMRVSPRVGLALTSLAGPASNIVTAFVLFLPFRLDLLRFPGGGLGAGLEYLIIISIGLAAFNLLPLPPLDGFAVFSGLLPEPLARQLDRVAVYGPGVLLTILMADWFLGIGILSKLLYPFIWAVRTLVLGPL